MLAEVQAPSRSRARGRSPKSGAAPRRLSEIIGDVDKRLPLPIQEFARVLGGGVVPGSLVLVGGDPGIGKSTLLLQMAAEMARFSTVLYVSGEESERQIKARLLRLANGSEAPDELYLLTETDLESILGHIQALKPGLVIVDSIQTVYLPEIESGAGSITQVREAANRLQILAKGEDIAIFLVGHVTKEGAIAGPRVLEHTVDTVLYLEGDSLHTYRLLRSVKNRFGPTTEVGVFEMRSAGLVEVPNPSEAFLAERVVNAPGSAVAVTLEGTRPLLVEIQGLTSATSFGHPRRTANGVDFNRVLLTIAVLSRRVGLKLADQDVFVNVVGGMRIHEPAADLAVAAAIASSVKDKPLAADLALVGEVGLSGELRAVPQMATRLWEASRLGFKRVVIPASARREDGWPSALDVTTSRTVREALNLALSSS
jgi:DNA repair protein RadA/Sms